MARKTPHQRPKNREVENEMIGTQKREGEPPRPATETGKGTRTDDGRPKPPPG